MAIDAGHVHPKSIFHADRGTQYTSAQFARFCARNDVVAASGAPAWLGQRRCRGLLRRPEERSLPPLQLAHPGPRTLRRRRVHRGLLQPPPTPFQPRLPHPRASPHRPPSSSNRCLINNARSCPRSLTQPTRDQHCRAPGCFRRAVTCDLDHVQRFSKGGPTNARNLQPLCERHHKMKHDAGWTVEVHDDGTTLWTTPTGHAASVEPATYPLDTTSTYREPMVHIDYRWHHAAV